MEMLDVEEGCQEIYINASVISTVHNHAGSLISICDGWTLACFDSPSNVAPD